MKISTKILLESTDAEMTEGFSVEGPVLSHLLELRYLKDWINLC